MHQSSLIPLAFAALAAAAPAPAPIAAPLVPRKNSGSTEWSFRKAALKADGFTSDKWTAAYHKAKEVVAGLSFDEKMNFTAIGRSAQPCAARSYPLKAAGLDDGFCFMDGPAGPNTVFSTHFPAEITTAATWDRDLIYARSVAMGSEYREMGVEVPLSICIGPMGRHPLGGRNWESFSPDPYLAGEAVRLAVLGMQEQGVVGLVKHWVGNEQEYLRTGALEGGYSNNLTYTVDTYIDRATVHELYAWPFAEAVRAGTGAVMCSYNLYNGASACESDELLNELLKQELNFGGFVISDWGASHTTLGSAVNGTDWIAPSNLFGDLLAELVANGTVPEDIADDKIIRMLTPYFALDQASIPELDAERYVASKKVATVVREVAEGAMTLLKNVRSTSNERGLPLQDTKRLLLVGSSATPASLGFIANRGFPAFNPEADFSGFNAGGYGSGNSPVPYAIDPLNAFITRGQQEERPVHVDYYGSDDPLAGVITGQSLFGNTSLLDAKLEIFDTAIVFVTAVAMEGWDRQNLTLQNGGDELINYVASRHNDTVVMITAPGPVDMSSWNDHENVTAIVFAYFSGQEGGHAMANVVFGDVNPSGRLPFAIAKSVDDYDAGAIWHGEPTTNPPIPFDEGVFIDYKYFDQQNIEPLYEFGYGLSYTTFNISDVAVAAEHKVAYASVRETNEKYFVDGQKTGGLYDQVYKVTATVTNTGEVDGAEVAQLYLSFPDSTPKAMPVRSLRGFVKSHLAAGASDTVTFPLRNKDLAYYDTELGGWVVPKGKFKLAVGTSSRKLAATVNISV
ncbi:hypothetical protein Rhopal_002727-T1 [Rhodotorula paludigena]|uniref:beta-glucosidase n=1 Tax=Rhodotorula paludigena TaxID=86838 RepID=A0AAV5GM39_9BASI|nr:hypothetical protein Rhopal_002727-T1 [Rhodotorula paludigena]